MNGVLSQVQYNQKIFMKKRDNDQGVTSKQKPRRKKKILFFIYVKPVVLS